MGNVKDASEKKFHSEKLDFSPFERDSVDLWHDFSARHKSELRSIFLGKGRSSTEYLDFVTRIGDSRSHVIDSWPDLDAESLRATLRDAHDPIDPLAAVAPSTPVVNSEPDVILQENRGEASRRYAARMERFEFGDVGNPYLKATIQERIERWENGIGQKQLSALAELMNKSIEEVEDLLQRKIEELMEKSQFFRATETDVFLRHIINGERRYKSQFETGRSNGSYLPSRRSEKEGELFGFPAHYSPEGLETVKYRPIYGYFSLDKNGILNDAGKHPPINSVSNYGSVTVKIKTEVAKQRTTMAFRDTLYMTNIPLTPVALPHYSAFFFFRGTPEHRLKMLQAFLDEPIDNGTFSRMRSPFSYTEAQYHGGLSVDDIESVHLSLGNGLTQTEIDQVTVAIEAFNQETGNNIRAVIY